MSQVTIYSLADGTLLRTFEGPDHMVDMQLAIGEAAYDELLPLEGCRIDLDTGEPVYFEPTARSADHEWDAERHEHVLSAEGLQRRQVASEIMFIEMGQARTMRELALGDKTALTRLRAIDEQIAAARQRMSGGNETLDDSMDGAVDDERLRRDS